MARIHFIPHSMTILSLALAGCGVGGGGGKKTSVTITNKVDSVQAGQTVDFDVNVQHDQGAGFTVTLTGAGALVQNGGVATYIAPPTVPNPNLVTITITAANGSGAKDEMTFTIQPAPGPVVNVSPATFEVTGGGTPFTLTITVTDDDPADVLTAGVNSGVGTFSPFSGAVGGGTYTVQFIPLPNVAEDTTQELHVMSSGQFDTSGPSGLVTNSDFGAGNSYAINPDGSGTIFNAGFPLVTNGSLIYFIDNRPGVVHPAVSTLSR